MQEFSFGTGSANSSSRLGLVLLQLAIKRRLAQDFVSVELAQSTKDRFFFQFREGNDTVARGGDFEDFDGAL